MVERETGHPTPEYNDRKIRKLVWLKEQFNGPFLCFQFNIADHPCVLGQVT